MKQRMNYIKLGIILTITIILTLSFSNLYRNYERNKISEGFISKYVSVVKYNELASILTEMNSDTLLYISYVNDKDVYNLEKKIRKVLKNNELEDNFFFVDATNYINDSKIVTNLNSTLNIASDESVVLPAIVYFKNNIPMDYIDSKANLINTTDLELLLEKYELEIDKND